MRRSYTQLAVLIAILLVANSLTIDADGQSSNQQAQLYFFTNAACGPCRMVEPELEQLFREGYSIMKIDTSVHPDWTQRFQVARTPTVVMVQGNQVIGRKSGYVDAATLRQWFIQAERDVQPTKSESVDENRLPQRSQQATQNQAAQTQAAQLTDTRTKGTFKPTNDAEQLTMQATVRLKIDDPQGSSYATGTVIHSFEGESLVLTCGHVFRDSEGKGTISAEYGFLEEQTTFAKGELLYYDADERDIGLVAIRTDNNIEPVTVAKVSYPVQKGDQIFSIGCDHGERPSIRHSRVKNQAKYDGVNKYEIYGRPVNGRSGGGMFTSGGQLVGVCNAAVVDVDEGVYVALDTIHWQFDQVNLAHLFDVNAMPNRSDSLLESQPKARVAAVSPRRGGSRRDLSAVPIRNALNADDKLARQLPDVNAVVTNNVVNSNSETELIIVLRNKNSLGTSESWTVANPSSDLIDDLKGMGNSTVQKDSSRNRMAQLRRDMPNLQNARSNIYNSNWMRAQSPR